MMEPSVKSPAEPTLSLSERLGLIGLIEEGSRQGESGTPVVADLFNNLWDLVGTTVRGAKIDRLKPAADGNIFQVLEVNAETGQNLGRLNMLYLNKPIPCYYLVYVEVSAPFRRKGLGNLIITYFRDFLVDKNAVGILDNIIPKEDPTYDIYIKHGWRPVDELTGVDPDGDYMVFIPPRVMEKEPDLKQPLLKLLYHLKRRRPAIDMKDNEQMVRQTIAEFRELYSALLLYFDDDIRENRQTPLMRFMFTRFVTKLIAFRRRISDLLGYTGGDSLQQIVLDEKIASLPVQSYAPRDLVSGPSLINNRTNSGLNLPPEFIESPARKIESLPNYLRPSFKYWLEEHGRSANDPLTIGDLMDLGFDPTRLKEINLSGEDYVFERIQIRQLPELEKKKDRLLKLAESAPGAKVKGAGLSVNPPLLTIRDRGNAYILRKKVSGIHWEEAVEQMESNPALKSLNQQMHIDRLIKATVRGVVTAAAGYLGEPEAELRDDLACFVSWDLNGNRPRIIADFTSTFLETVWLA